jgi:hypothetical protein
MPKKTGATGIFNGRRTKQISCPICHEHDVVVYLDDQGNPLDSICIEQSTSLPENSFPVTTLAIIAPIRDD